MQTEGIKQEAYKILDQLPDQDSYCKPHPKSLLLFL